MPGKELMSGIAKYQSSDLTLRLPTEEGGGFRTFLTAIGDSLTPAPICIFGLTGGHERWTILRFPEEILHMPSERVIIALRPFMRSYRRTFKGFVPFFGVLTGFRLVRAADYVQFDAEGNLRDWRC